MFVTDRAEWANTLNKCTRWVFPFGYYPVLVLSLIIWGYTNEANAAFWLVLVFGFTIVTSLFVIQLRHEIGFENARRARTIHLLQSTLTTDPNFVNVLRDAFVAFDTDDSGDISVAEMRELLEIIFPHEDRQEFVQVIKEIKQFANSSDTFDLNSFIDAVIMAVMYIRQRNGGEEADIKYHKMDTGSSFLSLPSRGLFSAVVSVFSCASSKTAPAPPMFSRTKSGLRIPRTSEVEQPSELKSRVTAAE